MAIWPKPTELAILKVNGQKFQDWESVLVRCSVHDAPPFRCRFTCSEGTPFASNFAKMQIMPGMDCEVTLAGFPAFTGKVETRQVYVDSKRHYIEIMCAGLVDVITSTVIHQTGEWKDKTFQQIAEPLLKKLGVKLVFEGGSPPSYKFKRVSSMPGEGLYDFLAVLGRSLGLHFTSNPQGDFVVITGPSSGGDTITEGQNMLIGREILYRPSITSYLPSATQGPGNDQDHGSKVAHMPFNQQAMDAFLSTTFATAPALIRAEMATSDKNQLKGRSDTEGQIMEGDKITVFATVQGWLRPSGGLWKREQDVVVNSPMLVMKSEKLKAKNVEFTQDNQTGTRTTLELCNPAAFGKIPPAATT